MRFAINTGRGKGKGKMIEAFIIEQLKKKEQEKNSAWSPLPLELPLPEDDHWEDKKAPRESDKDTPKPVRINF